MDLPAYTNVTNACLKERHFNHFLVLHGNVCCLSGVQNWLFYQERKPVLYFKLMNSHLFDFFHVIVVRAQMQANLIDIFIVPTDAS